MHASFIFKRNYFLLTRKHTHTERRVSLLTSILMSNYSIIKHCKSKLNESIYSRLLRAKKDIEIIL